MRRASSRLASFLAASAVVGVACAPGKDPAPVGLLASVVPVVSATTPPRRAIQETFVQAATRFFPGAPAAFRVEVDRVTGRLASDPIEGASVSVRLLQKGKPVATLLESVTDGSGGVEKSVPFPAVPDGAYDLVVETKSDAGKESQQTPVTVSRRAKLLLVTDKPIYQPGQTIHLRALALHEFDLTPAAGTEVEVSVEDGKGNRVFKKKLTAGEFGQVSTEMALADEVNEGDWHIKASVPAPPTGGEEVDAEKSVSVKHYVLPKFKLSLDGGKGFFKPGETVHGKVEAGYFFGKPVAGGEVIVTASTFDVEMHPFQELHGTTDADGHFSFDLALPTTFVGQPLQNGDALLKLDLAVKDKAEHTERITKSFPVAPAGFRVDLIPESGTLVPGVENRIYAV